MKLDGYTRLAAVVANPIKHSISPFIHNRAFEATATNGAYVAWEIEASDLVETVANIRATRCLASICPCPIRSR
ncbi:shikimate 5-dehydrogenase [Streptococcus pneumoniae]|nr:shikimate 5-dehydrogenase [Streptococcus pneumoniae]